MDTIKDYIQSGLLELYVLGATTEEENTLIASLAKQYPQIKDEIDSISNALLLTAEACAPELNPANKAMLMAKIHFEERIAKGEEIVEAPYLSPNSTIKDFETWLNREDMQLSEYFSDLEAKIISANANATTLIVWLQHGAPSEIHVKEYEHFLIVEGTCTIQIGEELYPLQPGDYLSIPLHIPHSVTVTSAAYCKVILQRIAA